MSKSASISRQCIQLSPPPFSCNYILFFTVEVTNPRICPTPELAHY